GEVVFREGGIPSGIYYLVKGKIKKYKTTSKGSEQIFYVCTAGELLGYHAILSEEHYPDSAATLVESEITFIPKENFLNLLQASSVLSNKLLKTLGHEFSVFINVITSIATKPVRERVALNLLILDEKFKPDGKAELPSEINMSRTDLANMVGTAKETLVRLLQQFKSDGLIESNGRIIRILNRKGIIREANLVGAHAKGF
ncbi:MAG TPA: Crp/Fnr family transcriptional regulator, partial [Chryseosolibacter sp.]|nr:Crp/Fnr family transcriptional regulator [Chryseosolibacter sp.]